MRNLEREDILPIPPSLKDILLPPPIPILPPPILPIPMLELAVALLLKQWLSDGKGTLNVYGAGFETIDVKRWNAIADCELGSLASAR